MDDKDVMAKLSELETQFKYMASSLEEIKTSVKEVVTLDRAIVELNIHHKQAEKELQTQWGKIDENQRSIEAVDRKADEWINKARGAWSMTAILATVAQAAILAMIAWTFNHIRAAEDDLLLLKTQLIRIEQQMKENHK